MPNLMKLQRGLVLICYNIIDKIPEFSIEVANNLIEDYPGNDFDVVLISRNNSEFGDLGETLPIQLLAKGDTLEYGFTIETMD